MEAENITGIRDGALQMERKIERYLSVDFIRGISLFLNVFVHIFTDVFDIGQIQDNLFTFPFSILLVFIAIGYFGSFGSLFIMISGTGNMISMLNSAEKGKNVKDIVLRQLVGGIILLAFSFLVEGLFQFYGYLGTFFAMNGHDHDPTRIVWHAFSMTPVHCLAVGMIATSIVQYFLLLGRGHLKTCRNVLVYAILAIAVVAISQPVWDACKAAIPGFPSAHISTLYPGDWPGDYKVYMPPPGAGIVEYIANFFLMLAGGSNHPIFPFLAATFIGNIVGIILVAEKRKEKPDAHVPRYGIYAGLLIAVAGVAMIFVLGVDFNSVLPVNNVGDITGINNGLDAFWLPWFCFLIAGEVMLVFLTIRLIEYRGATRVFGDKTKFLRRFGMPAFSVYAWHRFWSIPAVFIISSIAGNPSWPGGTITDTAVDAFTTIIILVASWASCGAILIAWEKVGYIGGIEWMMGTVSAAFGKNFRKTKGTTKERARWWEFGKMDVDTLFYKPEWIAIIPKDSQFKEQRLDSKLATKLAITGFFFGPFSILALGISLIARRTEGKNPHNTRAVRASAAGIAIMIAIVVVLSLVTLGTLGIEL